MPGRRTEARPQRNLTSLRQPPTLFRIFSDSLRTLSFLLCWSTFCMASRVRSFAESATLPAILPAAEIAFGRRGWRLDSRPSGDRIRLSNRFAERWLSGRKRRFVNSFSHLGASSCESVNYSFRHPLRLKPEYRWSRRKLSKPPFRLSRQPASWGVRSSFRIVPAARTKPCRTAAKRWTGRDSQAGPCSRSVEVLAPIRIGRRGDGKSLTQPAGVARIRLELPPPLRASYTRRKPCLGC